MKLVRENIDFKRGMDPKKSLGLGKYSKKYYPVKWDEMENGTYRLVFTEKNMWGDESFIIKDEKEIKLYAFDKNGKLIFSNRDMIKTLDFNESFHYSYVIKSDKIIKKP